MVRLLNMIYAYYTGQIIVREGYIASLGERERAHLVVQLASSVSPDTVSFLNVSTRFYLGVHAVRNIATTSCVWIEDLGSSID